MGGGAWWGFVAVGRGGWWGFGWTPPRGPPALRPGSLARGPSAPHHASWFLARPPSSAPQHHRVFARYLHGREGGQDRFLRGGESWGVEVARRCKRSAVSRGVERARGCKRSCPPSRPQQNAARNLWSRGAQEGGPRKKPPRVVGLRRTARVQAQSHPKRSARGGCSPKPHQPRAQTTLEAPPRAFKPSRTQSGPRRGESPKPHQPPLPTATKPHLTAASHRYKTPRRLTAAAPARPARSA